MLDVRLILRSVKALQLNKINMYQIFSSANGRNRQTNRDTDCNKFASREGLFYIFGVIMVATGENVTQEMSAATSMVVE